ncbi:MAG: outer membrane beta-barrel protein [Ginsengibacter sp.]
MQYTEDDMNDLFRKAAEGYAPKKGDSNWQDISDRITEHYKEKQLGPAKKTSISKTYIALIFLFISITGGWIVFKNTSFDKRVFSGDKNKSTSTKRNNTAPYLSENNTNSLLTNPNKLKQPNRIYSQSKLKDNAAKSINLFAKEFDGQSDIINTYADAGRQNNIMSESEINQKEQDLKSQYSFQENNETKSIDTSASYVDKTTGADKLLNKIKPGKENKVKRSDNNVLNKQRGAYVGLSTAIDFSNVKSSSVDDAGYALGFLAGYKLNKKISLETGLIFNRRNYNSEGRYFNMDKIKSSMPAGMHIKSLYTNSAVIEFPFKVKYGLVSVAKSNIFITGGASAYMITRQKNNYQASLNGNDEQFSGMYSKNDFLLPAALSMSIGYEHTISKFLNIRAEPFLKIPLKGMGIGNLPVTSAGMQLSITRTLN